MKNKKVICLFSLLLSFALFFTAFNSSVFSVDARAEDKLGQFVTSADRPCIAEMEMEPKVYCGATIDQDFDGSSVLVVMDKAVSRINRVFDKSFFGDIAIAGIEDLSIVVNEALLTANDYRPIPSAGSWAADYGAANAEKKLPDNWKIDRENFRQILLITLPTDSKENVLKVIAELEQIDGVKSAEPNTRLDSLDAVATVPAPFFGC